MKKTTILSFLLLIMINNLCTSQIITPTPGIKPFDAENFNKPESVSSQVKHMIISQVVKIPDSPEKVETIKTGEAYLIINKDLLIIKLDNSKSFNFTIKSKGIFVPKKYIEFLGIDPKGTNCKIRMNSNACTIVYADEIYIRYYFIGNYFPVETETFK